MGVELLQEEASALLSPSLPAASPSLPRDWTRSSSRPRRGAQMTCPRRRARLLPAASVKLRLSGRWEPLDQGFGLWPETLLFPSKSVRRRGRVFS